METKEILKQLRESKGFTIQDVAKKIGMQYTMCREYETGVRNLGMSAAMKFADFYNVSLDYLMGRTPVKQMATEQPDPLAEIDVSALEKRIIKKYTEFNDFERAVCVELLRQLTTVFDGEESPQPAETPITQQSQWRFTARRTDGCYESRPATSEEVEKLKLLENDPEPEF